MEGVQSWSGDQSRLIGDPQVLDGVKGVGEDDPTVTQAHLEDRPVLLDPAAGHLRMVFAKLKQIPKDRDARNLWEVFDFGSVGRVDVPQNKKPDGQERK